MEWTLDFHSSSLKKKHIGWLPYEFKLFGLPTMPKGPVNSALSICLHVRLSLSPSVRSSICPLVCLSIHLPTFPSLSSLSICTFICCWPICLFEFSLCPSVLSSACLSAHPSFPLSICLSVFLPKGSMNLALSIHHSFQPSFCLSIWWPLW